ncbi:MAG: transposase [Chitinophagaceae bacterium]|nr:transposase [Chitinophagaceae bacterium]
MVRKRHITLQFIQPGRPMRMLLLKKKRSIRRELLNAYIFTTMREVREHWKWRQDYNTEAAQILTISIASDVC